MVRKLTRASIESQISGLRALIDSLDENDDLGRVSLEGRLEDLQESLERLGDEIRTTGSVLLSFEGGPVTGSKGVDAEFAANVLHDYQELIAKQMAAADTGGLAQRGPVPSKDLARLNVTGVVHGSFGFQLEERASDEPQLVDSAVKRSIEEVDRLLVAFASNNYDDFSQALAIVDRRVFITVKSFFESLYRDSAALKIIEEDRSMSFDQRAVIVARDRISGVEVEDNEIILRGELLGLAPIQRRFDFRSSEDARVISGQVGQRMSDDYLERLHGEDRISGRLYIATMSRRVATRVDGSVSESFTLLDLRDPSGELGKRALTLGD
jgi:hypothetical protein